MTLRGSPDGPARTLYWHCRGAQATTRASASAQISMRHAPSARHGRSERGGGFLKQESGPEAKKLLDELIRKQESHKLKRLYNVQDD